MYIVSIENTTYEVGLSHPKQEPYLDENGNQQVLFGRPIFVADESPELNVFVSDDTGETFSLVYPLHKLSAKTLFAALTLSIRNRVIRLFRYFRKDC